MMKGMIVMLKDLILQSDLELEYLNSLRDEIIAEQSLAVWGTGRGAAKLLQFMKKIGWGGDLRFIDSNDEKCATPYCGYQVVSPCEYFGSGYNPKIPIVITCADVDGVRKALKSYGSCSKVIVSDLTSIDVHESWHDYIWKHMNDFSDAYELLEDEMSRNVFAGLLNYRISRDEHYLEGLVEDIETMYLEESLFPIKGISIADCGAYIGDSVEDFIRKTEGEYRKIYAFEPDPIIYAKLVENISRNNWKRVEAYNIGCYSEKATLRFESEGKGTEMGNHLTDEGNSIVEVDSLDNVIGDEIGLIKMDIEGAERDALLGCKRLIREYHPVLAICIYHMRDDYYILPKVIHDLNPDYKLYVRQYSYTDNETILYAV